MSFKVGDKVRIVQPGIGVDEKNDGVGMVGTICSVPKYGWSAYGVDSPEFKTEKGQRGFDRLWWFEPHMLELVDDDQRSSVQTSQQSRTYHYHH